MLSVRELLEFCQNTGIFGTNFATSTYQQNKAAPPPKTPPIIVVLELDLSTDLVQSLLEISDDVIRIFHTDGESDEVAGDAGFSELLVRKLSVCM